MDKEQFAQFMNMMQSAMQTIGTQSKPAKVVASSPLILNFEQYKKDEKFSQYKERFENFSKIKGIQDDKELLKQTFLNCVGSEIYEMVKSINAPVTIDKLSYIQITESLEKYLSPKPNILIEQHRFLCRFQKEKESIGEYVAALRKFLPTCEFNCECGKSIADSFLRAQFIRGISDSSIREKLLQESDLKFQKAVDMALAFENSKLDNREMKSQSSNFEISENQKVNRVSRERKQNFRGNSGGNNNFPNKFQRSRSFSSPRFNSNSNSGNGGRSYNDRGKSRSHVNFKEIGIADLCIKCGRNNHKSNDCRVNISKLKCNACGRSGHVERVCITTLVSKKRNNSVKNVDDVNDESMSSNYLDLHDFKDTYQLSTVELSNNKPDRFRNRDMCEGSTPPVSHNLGRFRTREVCEDSQVCQDVGRFQTVNLYEVSSISKDSEKFFVNLSIESKQQEFEVDSGCGFTLLPEDKFKMLNIQSQMQKSPCRFRTYDGGIVQPLGIVSVKVQYKNVQSRETLFIVPEGHSAIVGRVWIRHLKISLPELDTKDDLRAEIFSVEPLPLQAFVDKFPRIFEQSVGIIPGLKGSLSLRANSKPVYIKARDVPYAVMSGVEDEINELVKNQIFTFVEKSDWGSPLVPVPKPNGKIRLCVDYKVAVNPQLTGAHYPIPRIDYIISQFRGSKFYCKLDLYQAYYHIEMDEESRKIQTVSTHKGTYLVNRLSMGIKTAPSEFHRIMDTVLQRLNGVMTYFDDIIVHGETIAQCQENLIACFQRLQDNNLHLNKEKCVLFQTKVAYLGYLIEGRNIQKDPRKVKAIIDAPPPKDEKGVKQFLGLVTYYSKFIANVSTITYPIRNLLKKTCKFQWSNECDAAFKKLKNLMASDQVLVAYDPKLPVTVACDASPVGIGAVLSHIIDGTERPVAYISRSLTCAEQNYSQIDREALAIVFALDKFHIYVYGRKFTLITDNRPLTRIFHQHAKLPPMTASRLLRYAAYLTSFNYEVQHRPSEEHANVDFLSRFPLPDTEPSVNQLRIEMEVLQCQEETLSQIMSSCITSTDIERETKADPDLSKLLTELRESSSEENSEFTINGDVIFKGSRVYIPVKLRQSVLNELHMTHSGITKMKQLARRYCYWPSINADIEKLVRSCESCAMTQKSPAKAPLHQWEQPQQNFDRVHIDYAGPKDGLFYLILVDAKSKWPEIRIISKSPSTESTIALLEDIFLIHGYPKLLVSDNATIFVSETFTQYCKDRGIFQCFSAPGHPATNGLAERYVQILKSKLAKMESSPEPITKKVKDILFQFRATPLQSGKSPAELYLNRQLRIRLDAIKPVKPDRNLKPPVKVREFRNGQRVLSKVYQNNQFKWQFGSIVKRLGRLHYVVKLQNGHTLKRHIDQLKATEVPDTSHRPENLKGENSSQTGQRHVKFSSQPTIIDYEPSQRRIQKRDAEPAPQAVPTTPRRSNRDKRQPSRLGINA